MLGAGRPACRCLGQGPVGAHTQSLMVFQPQPPWPGEGKDGSGRLVTLGVPSEILCLGLWAGAGPLKAVRTDQTQFFPILSLGCRAEPFLLSGW